jgi:leader peptidase (prepilin peptidase)/N-methyltransferase
MTAYIGSAVSGAVVYGVVQRFIGPRLPIQGHTCLIEQLLFGFLAAIIMALTPLWTSSWSGYIWASSVLAITILVIMTDMNCFWIPDEAVLLLIWVNGIAYWYGLSQPDLYACILVISFFLLLYIAIPGSIGSGDVKLAIALCLGCTAKTAYAMTVIAFVLGTMAGLHAWRQHGQAVIPFGPHLLVGWWIATILGHGWYAWLELSNI